jgi:predicted dehydrogenase
MTPTIMLKTVVVGMGGIGNTHADCYLSHPECQLVAVCDIIKERADAAAERTGAKAYYSIQDMLKGEDEIGLASMCTAGSENGGDHYQATMELLEAGLNVLGEKPISNEILKAREMVAKAKEKGVYYGINLNHRFTPPTRRAKEWVERGDIGEPQFMNMNMWINNPKDEEYFHMRALHPHSVDIMRYFGGEVGQVQAFMTKAPGRNCWSNAQVNMKFENDMLGHLTGSYDINPAHNLERLEIAGPEGRIVLVNLGESLWLYPNGSDEVRVVYDSMMGGFGGFPATFPLRIHHYVNQLLEGVGPENLEASGDDGLAAQEVIEGAIKSHEGGTVEKVPVEV